MREKAQQLWWREVEVGCGVGREARIALRPGGSDTRAVRGEWEMGKQAPGSEMGGVERRMEQQGCTDGANFYRAFL